MMTLTLRGVQYPLHYRAEKIFGQEVWKVTVTIQDQTFTRASTDKKLFMKTCHLNSFYEIQKALHGSFFKSFKPEIINYLNK